MGPTIPIDYTIKYTITKNIFVDERTKPLSKIKGRFGASLLRRACKYKIKG